MNPNHSRRASAIVLVTAATLLWSTLGSAALVNPGQTIPLSGTTSAASPDLVGGAIQNDALAPFQLSTPSLDFIGGNVQPRVYPSLDLGTLIFSPRIRDTFNLASFLEFAVITGLDYSGFAGFSTDVEYRTDGAGDQGPDSVSRSADGDTLSFDFSSAGAAIAPPQESLFLSILSNATAWDNSGTITIHGKTDFASATVYSVTLTGMPAPVPLPAAGWLMLGALGLLGRRRHRRP